MTFYVDWPLWAQVLLPLGVVGSYVPAYFICQWVRQCFKDGKAKDNTIIV